jgi:peroxiredoxin Q/BCP
MNRLVMFLFWMVVTAPAWALEVGDQAPGFELHGTDGKIHRLQNFTGKSALVLAWYPQAFTSGCTLECKSFAENGHLIRAYGVPYFMVSVDPLEENERFALATKADFPLLSDPTKEIATAYGVLGQRGVANRWTFYIDKDGRISHIDKAVRPATSAEDMIAKLGELKVAMAH